MPLPPAAAAAAGRHGVVSPDDRGPVVQIVAWIFMVAMVLFTATRLAVRYISAHTPGLDDWIVLAAMFLGVGVVIALSLAVNDGLGKRMPGRLAAVEKHVYSATILYLLTLCLAKLSVIVFLARLAAAKTHLAATWALGALTLAWALASVLGFAFRCAMPAPWTFDESCCFDSIAFWKASAAVDMLTDAAMVLLPICILWRIRVAFRKKCLVVSLFALRFLAIAAAALRLHYLLHPPHTAGTKTNNNAPPQPSPPSPAPHPHPNPNPTPTFDLVPTLLATLAHATAAVIASCLPALKPFVDNAASGMLDFSLRARGRGTTYGRAGVGREWAGREGVVGVRGVGREVVGVGGRKGKGRGKERLGEGRGDSGIGVDVDGDVDTSTSTGAGAGAREEEDGVVVVEVEGEAEEEEEEEEIATTTVGSVGSEGGILNFGGGGRAL